MSAKMRFLDSPGWLLSATVAGMVLGTIIYKTVTHGPTIAAGLTWDAFLIGSASLAIAIAMQLNVTRGRMSLLRIFELMVAVALLATLLHSHNRALEELEASKERAEKRAGDGHTLDLYENPPMTIAASCLGRFSGASSWHLSLSSAGTGQLYLMGEFNEAIHSVEVDKEQYDRLKSQVKQDYFNLSKSSYGGLVSSGSTCYTTITLGKQTKTVELHFFRNLAELEMLEETDQIEEYEEAKKAAALFSAIRACFENEDAVDYTEIWDDIFDEE